MKNKFKFLIIFILISLFGLISIVLFKSGDNLIQSDESEIISTLKQKEQINKSISKTEHIVNAIELQGISRDITKSIIPSIVSITATQYKSSLTDEAYHYEKGSENELYKDEYLGSGVIISEDGYIITVAHLIQNAEEINIVLNDDSVYEADIIGTDNSYDIAVLKIDAEESLSVAYLGNSDDVKTGDFGFAVGNPFGLSGTVTFGIVSAVDRTLDTSPGSYYIQTDAEINTGNSGGAFVNIKGQVIGINKSIFSYGLGNNIGISFAIPINIVKKSALSLIKGEPLQKPFLGLVFKDGVLSSQVKSLRSEEGLRVVSVYEGSPASKAGLEKDSIILSINGQNVYRSVDYDKMLMSNNIGDKLTLRVKQGESILTRQLKLIRKPDYKKYRTSNFLGLVVGDVNKNYRNLNIPDSIKKGVVVIGIEKDSPSNGSGLKEGDLIIQIDEESIDRLDEYMLITDRLKQHTKARFMITVKRYGLNKDVAIRRIFYIENK